MTTLTKTEAGFLEVLTTDWDGTIYGYRLTGAMAGPTLLVAGTCETAEMVFNRLMRIPTLPWMRGTLVLIRLDHLDDIAGDSCKLPTLGPIERTLVLPVIDGGPEVEVQIRRTYHRVLRACADLGMIAGRGVAANKNDGNSN